MIVYTINNNDGRFCGYRRRWENWFLKRPWFTWEVMPFHEDVMTFVSREMAELYILAHHKDFGPSAKVMQSSTRDV